MIALKGMGTFQIHFKKYTWDLDLVVIQDPYVSLLGMNCFEPLGIEITGVNQTSAATLDFSKVCEEFPTVFDGILGLCNGYPVSLQLDPAIQPICLKVFRIPFTLKPKIDKELDHILEQGVLEPVPHGAWETPIVTQVKAYKAVCIFTDYKCTLNKALQDHAYLVPVVSHIISMLAKVFGKLHLAQAYQQLLVDEVIVDVQTIVMHQVTFGVKRLQFEVSIAPGYFKI